MFKTIFLVSSLLFAVSGAERSLLDHFGTFRSSEDVSVLKQSLLKKLATSSGFPNPLIPLIIIPPLTGTQIEVKLSGKKTHHMYCDRHSDWFLAWFPAVEELLPPLDNCWGETVSMEYSNGTFLNFPGVETRIPPFGGIEGIEYVGKGTTGPVWDVIVDTLVSAAGYEVGLNIRGAPYDWRLGPSALEAQLFPLLKQLFEETYAANNNTPAAAVSLSMGGPVFVLFLSTMDQAWKDKYVQSYTSFSGAFAGSSLAMLDSIASNSKRTYPSATVMRSLSRSLGIVPWLMPFEAVYGDAVFATTPSRSYRVSDFHQLFVDAGANVTAQMYDLAVPYQVNAAPGVPISCVYGYNSSTLLNLTFFTDDFTGNFTGGVSDGDGTVPIDGLRSCDIWARQQSQPSVSYPIVNMEHADDVHTMEAIEVLYHNMMLV
eukprot:TRINITY_DN18470_c0_g1_i1.p1 TRINITY_DN18470_c0_g1~~TRINITY_DN18470_c0_g1_i1.p1  ORF type:complete len:444 (+),score=94.60 TRINITY_DN18470_c0_g1_i1:48-1334(+)